MEIEYRPYVIQVTGDIICKEGRQCVQNLIAGSHSSVNVNEAGTFDYDPIAHSVDGNLVFDRYSRAVPYAMYRTERGIRVEIQNKGADFTCCHGFSSAFIYFKNNINQIHTLLSVQIPEVAQDVYYMGLYVDVFSILELFLCDYLLCGVFSNPEFYKNAIQYLDEEGIDYKKDPLSIENHIRDVISKVVFHRFDVTNSIFKRILSQELPNTDQLKDLLHKRNNIVHRFAVNNVDWMVMSVASAEDVKHLVSVVTDFVDKIEKGLK